MDAQIFRYSAVGADPDLTRRFCNVTFQRVVEFNRANLQRLIAKNFSLTCGGSRWASLRAMSVSEGSASGAGAAGMVF